MRLFLWTVWGFNLAEFGCFGFGLIRASIPGLISNWRDLLQFGAFQCVILFPCIFNYLALRLIRNYYPDKELHRWKRRIYNILGVLQIVHGLILATAGLYFFLDRLPRLSVEMRRTLIILWSIYVSAAVLNISAVVVVWRTMRVIRRNHRVALVEAF